MRDHFSTHELEKIDELRLRPQPATFSFQDKLFVCWAISKAVMTSDED